MLFPSFSCASVSLPLSRHQYYLHVIVERRGLCQLTAEEISELKAFKNISKNLFHVLKHIDQNAINDQKSLPKRSNKLIDFCVFRENLKQ